MINGVFGGSALYHREPWYKPESSGSKWAEWDDSSQMSSHFVKSNICFANLKLIQEMEDSMESLLGLNSRAEDWVQESYVFHDGKMFSASAYADLMKEATKEE